MKQVMILSGAGLSAPSGIKTFRASGGLWEEHDVMEVCSATGFKKIPKIYNKRRKELASVKLNHAHEIIALLKQKFPKQVSVLTQNVDDLLERAGCEDIVHLHGFLPELRCLECESIFNIGYESSDDKICPKCQSKNIRHNIVMFEEMAPNYKILYEKLHNCDLFVCIGTSGQVLPVGEYARVCKQSILNNLDEDKHLENNFTKVYIEDVCTAIDKIKIEIENFLEVKC
ncbi:NAD-dependent protein deacetylase, SIR2 family [Campylobacter subantarcticus LMG 24377]|uniref:protein acetyllysine N-acetyltransferase n=1 Tax=Campylobacter subantarcticus TaxID=497724 RepID=A0ABW9N6L9_9BACT|nr:NAD-dependent deacetylase, Sir2 family [Campylobacter subantarcticus]AJC92929.1 NAD-dependent protein deacetylase, SIR2 family [Campylobacter subantarcticus LMG 24377]EAL3939679.1 NAD-dependent deacetylase, Sir2 family [Campylobacter lari]MPB99889.1 NAD-dependent deacetylase, Sir2 family [Campylobacter subantarcticus]